MNRNDANWSTSIACTPRTDRRGTIEMSLHRTLRGRDPAYSIESGYRFGCLFVEYRIEPWGCNRRGASREPSHRDRNPYARPSHPPRWSRSTSSSTSGSRRRTAVNKIPYDDHLISSSGRFPWTSYYRWFPRRSTGEKCAQSDAISGAHSSLIRSCIVYRSFMHSTSKTTPPLKLLYLLSLGTPATLGHDHPALSLTVTFWNIDQYLGVQLDKVMHSLPQTIQFSTKKFLQPLNVVIWHLKLVVDIILSNFTPQEKSFQLIPVILELGKQVFHTYRVPKLHLKYTNCWGPSYS